MKRMQLQEIIPQIAVKLATIVYILVSKDSIRVDGIGSLAAVGVVGVYQQQHTVIESSSRGRVLTSGHE